MGLPTVNVPTSSLSGSNLSGSTNSVSNIQLSNLGAFLLNMPAANSNTDDNNEDNNEEEDDDDNALPPLEPVTHGFNSTTANLLLNFVNIYMNGMPPPLAPMVDVKNVVTEKQLEQLKVVTYSELKSEEAEKYKECIICLDSFEKDSKLRILKCDHGFHVDCIDKWLTDCNYKCPVCRDDSNEHHAEI
jgi:hypothetical protein